MEAAGGLGLRGYGIKVPTTNNIADKLAISLKDQTGFKNLSGLRTSTAQRDSNHHSPVGQTRIEI